MLRNHPVDCEKTQAPQTPYGLDPREAIDRDREYRLKESCDQVQGQVGRAYSQREIIAALFSYHPPTEETLPKFAAINQAAKNFAEVLLQNCPHGADLREAMLAIRTARMLANASISLNGLSL